MVAPARPAVPAPPPSSARHPRAADLRAQLDLVNEIGQALAQQLDFDAIVELVGERLRRIFRSRADDLYIAFHDPVNDQISFPYEFDGGRRIHSDPLEMGLGLTSIVIRTGRVLRLGHLEEQN